MNPALSMEEHVSLSRELDALRAAFARGCPCRGQKCPTSAASVDQQVRDLIAVTPAVRALLEEWVQRGMLPAHAVRSAIRRREAMLDLLDRQESDHVRHAA